MAVEDLEAFGIQGLLEAHSRFDASRGARFGTFAYYRIRGAMLDGVRKMVDAPPKGMLRAKRQQAADDIAESAGLDVRAELLPDANLAVIAAYHDLWQVEASFRMRA